MRYLEFKNKIQNMPLFNSQDIDLLDEDKQVVRNQIRRWQDKGFLIKLKRGIYILNKDDRKIIPSRLYIANQLYGPSYISLEFALNFYGLIPERVIDVTSVSTRKTNCFTNEFGTFSYRHMQRERFTGFRMGNDEANLSYFIATAEKAVVDFMYFNLRHFIGNFSRVIEENYRFQNVSELRRDAIVGYAKLFENSKLLKVCQEFCKFVSEGH